jgi:hypothetical protein
MLKAYKIIQLQSHMGYFVVATVQISNYFLSDLLLMADLDL